MPDQLVSPISDFNYTELKLKGFKVDEIKTTVSKAPTYIRRDYYKITLCSGHIVVHYADRSININGTFLFFGNPRVPYSIDLLSANLTGYGCLFTEAFLTPNDRSESLQQSPFLKIGGCPVFLLSNEQKAFLITIFQKMIAEKDTDYLFKDELMRNYINLIIHEALMLQPADHFFTHKNASSRITSLFLELLERQFPIDSPQRPLALRTAQDYASQLSIHVNHLSRSVKEVTGKPTTTHISDRIISEAKALLHHTDWSIADIAYGLGFDYPTHFNNYFKRMTGTIPTSFRA